MLRPKVAGAMTEQRDATHSEDEYRVVFDETGGYDCMTGSFDIVRQNGDIAAEVDLRHYGQKPCDYEGSGFVDAKERAEAVAHMICTAINARARSATRGAFIYLLNQFEQASQSDNPSLLDYARKRQALLDYVAKLETVPSEKGLSRVRAYLNEQYTTSTPAADILDGLEKLLASTPSAIRPIHEVSIPMADVIKTPCWNCGKTPLDGMA